LDGIKGENWYRQQDRSAYVLQLISASNIANVIELLEGMPGVQDQMSGYVKYTPSGRPRFLLFYGVYPDRDSAIAATSNIPARFRALNPYPRVVDNIIDEIEVLGYWPR
jgi:DamX protein